MKRRQNIWIALLAAVITFGSLYAIAGEKYLGKYSSKVGCHPHFSKTEEARWYQHGERPHVDQRTMLHLE